MFRAEVERAVVVAVGQDLLDLLQRRRRCDELHLPANAALRRPAPQREAIAVDRDDRDPVVRNFEQAARMDGARLIFADREDRPGDHLLQLLLRQHDALLALDIRQLRIVLGAHRRDGERRDAAPDGDLEVLVYADLDGIVRQLPHDVEEQPRREDGLAGLADVGDDADGDPRFQIIPGKHHLHTRADIDALECGDGALHGDGPAGDRDGRDEQIFFTGKFHRGSSFSSFHRKKG